MAATWKSCLAPVLLTALSMTAACGENEEAEPAPLTMDDGTQTLAAALGMNDDLGTLRRAIDQSELTGVFDGPASYTILAPDDAAFEALGEDGIALFEDEQRPMLVAILRDHLLPGHLTPEAIAEAIENNGGSVTMTSLGESEVTFAKTGDAITITAGDGAPATIAGTAIAANNGVVIPVDTVLLPSAQDAGA